MPASTDSLEDSEDRAPRLDRLVRDYRHAMISAARPFAPHGEEATAEDIVQDALAAILEKGITLPGTDEEALRVVTCRIRNLGLNRRRRERVRRTEPLDETHFADHGDATVAWKEAWKVQLARDLTAAMETLTNAERDVLRLHIFEDRTFADVAQNRRCSPKTAKELYRRARRKLREQMKGMH